MWCSRAAGGLQAWDSPEVSQLLHSRTRTSAAAAELRALGFLSEQRHGSLQLLCVMSTSQETASWCVTAVPGWAGV